MQPGFLLPEELKSWDALSRPNGDYHFNFDGRIARQLGDSNRAAGVAPTFAEQLDKES